MNSAPSSNFDWDQAKRRISELGTLLARSETVTEVEAQAILRMRAKRLAEPTEQQRRSENRIEVMMLHLAGERYALETSVIREVIRPILLTPLPGTEDRFAGLMNLRGRPLLIVDGRKLLGLTAAEASELARIIVVGTTQAEIGLLTDACDEVAELDVSELAEPPLSLDETARRFIRGVTQDAVSVFDTDRFSDDSQLWIDEQDE